MTARQETVEEPQILFSFLMFLIFLVGVTGNFSTLIIIKKKLAFQNVNQARLFLANLAVVDLPNFLQAIFSGLGFISKNILVTRAVCSLGLFLSGYANLFVRPLASFSLTLLTANRSYATAGHLFEYCSSWLYIIAAWVFSLLTCTIFAASYPHTAVKYEPGQGSCCSITGVDVMLPPLGTS